MGVEDTKAGEKKKQTFLFRIYDYPNLTKNGESKQNSDHHTLFQIILDQILFSFNVYNKFCKMILRSKTLKTIEQLLLYTLHYCRYTFFQSRTFLDCQRVIEGVMIGIIQGQCWTLAVTLSLGSLIPTHHTHCSSKTVSR